MGSLVLKLHLSHSFLLTSDTTIRMTDKQNSELFDLVDQVRDGGLDDPNPVLLPSRMLNRVPVWLVLERGSWKSGWGIVTSTSISG